MAEANTAHTTTEATTAETSHHSVHIPKMEGEAIPGFSIFGLAVTNTIFSTWIIMAVILAVSVWFFRSLGSASASRMRTAGLSAVKFIDDFLQEFIGNKKLVRGLFPIFAGFFIFILVANLGSLFLDWLVLVSGQNWLATYLRPVNSDLNTTLVMAALIIVLSHIVMVRTRGFGGYLKGYLFNYSGSTGIEKGVNVFVGWLHLIGEGSKLLSLSLRLFGNIFAGVVLISVMAFLTGKLSLLGVEIGQIGVLPFWLFELFVAVIQAIVFFILTAVYFKDAASHHH